MQKPPRKPDESFFSDGLMGRIFFRGILIGICTLVVFSTVIRTGGTLEAARTAALCTLILSQLVHVFECKSERRTLFSMPYGNNLWLIGAVAVSLAVLAAAVVLPMLRVIFSTVMLTRPQLYIALGFSLAVPLCSSVAGLFRRKNRKFPYYNSIAQPSGVLPWRLFWRVYAFLTSILQNHGGRRRTRCGTITRRRNA
ncbi:MAG: cation transporting ATPase C-terminal domain-containing protein [Ruminococcus callidus]